MTSNIGAEVLAEQPAGADVEDVREQVMERVRGYFRPEFINRIDEILLFRRLSRDHMAGIVDIQLRRLEKLLKDRRITVELDSKAKEFLAERGYDPVYGARPLKRVIQKELQNKLSEMILRGEVVDGAKIDVSVKKDALSFDVKEVNNKDTKSVA
jgi:ATP-dependent Clp protease ATP-binding subunit ClpB